MHEGMTEELAKHKPTGTTGTTGATGNGGAPGAEKLCEHEWSEETLREPTFRVSYGARRTCRRCGRVQYADYASGRVGGNWVDVVGNDGSEAGAVAPSLHADVGATIGKETDR